MNAFTTTKTSAGLAAIAASGLLAVGIAMPATANTSSTSVDQSERSTMTETTTSVLDSIQAVLNGGSITGGITGGDPAISENSLGGSISDFVGGISLDSLVSDVAGGDVAGIGDVAGVGDIAGVGDVSNSGPVVVAPQTGDIASGNELGNGNAVGSGNDVTAPIGSGNTTNVDLGDVNNVVTDVVDVDGIVSDITNSVDVNGIVSDVTGSLTSILGR